MRTGAIGPGLAMALLAALPGWAEGALLVEGQRVAVTESADGLDVLTVNGAVLHENGVIYLDPGTVTVDGVTLVTGAAGAGGNACNAAPFVLALPPGGAPEFWGPLDTCAYLTPEVEEGRLVFASDPMAGAAGETWVWSRTGGFTPGPAVGFVSDKGWEVLDSLAGAHPGDALAIAPVAQALQAGMGADYPMFLERITGLGSGDLTAAGYQGEACIKLTCEGDWAILYLDRATRQPFAIWHVHGEIENRIFPQDTTQWPPEAMALLRDRAGD